MRTKQQVVAGLLGALLLLPVPASAIVAQRAQGSNRITTRQTLPGSTRLARRELNRHQRQERRQLNIYFRRLSALLRAHQLVERRLLLASAFQVPPPVAPIPTPFPF